MEYDTTFSGMTGKAIEDTADTQISTVRIAVSGMTACHVFAALQIINFQHADPKLDEALKAARAVLVACGQALAKEGRF